MPTPRDGGERRARIDAFDFRSLTPFVQFGTASDRYAGWIGQIYPESYRERVSARSRKLGGKTFREETLPIDSVAYYFQHFDVLELDFTFYRPLVEADGRPGPNLRVLRTYADEAPPHARFLVKAPQTFFARRFRRGGGSFEPNQRYLDAEAMIRQFIEPARIVLGDRLAGIVYEQEYQRKAESGSSEENVAAFDAFFRAVGNDVQAHVELRSPHLLDDHYFAWLRERGIGHVFSHWTWLPPIRDQWKSAGGRFSAADRTAVARLLTPLRVKYADAYATAHPFDRAVPSLSESDHGRRLVLDATALAFQGQLQEHCVVLIANNRAWGNAPLLARAIAERILDETDRREGS